jgi:hypothetical protein
VAAPSDAHDEEVLDVREAAVHLFRKDGSTAQPDLALHADDHFMLLYAAAKVVRISVLNFFTRVDFVKDESSCFLL